MSQKENGSTSAKTRSQKKAKSDYAKSAAVSKAVAQYRENLEKAFERFSIIEEALWRRIQATTDITDTRAWIDAAYQLRIVASNRAKLKELEK